MKLKAHVLTHEIEVPITIAWVHPASKKSVKLVLDATTDGHDGRSNWMWVRLPNGDLILGVYPQGATYETVEKDAQHPHG